MLTLLLIERLTLYYGWWRVPTGGASDTGPPLKAMKRNETLLSSCVGTARALREPQLARFLADLRHQTNRDRETNAFCRLQRLFNNTITNVYARTEICELRGVELRLMSSQSVVPRGEHMEHRTRRDLLTRFTDKKERKRNAATATLVLSSVLPWRYTERLAHIAGISRYSSSIAPSTRLEKIWVFQEAAHRSQTVLHPVRCLCPEAPGLLRASIQPPRDPHTRHVERIGSQRSN